MKYTTQKDNSGLWSFRIETPEGIVTGVRATLSDAMAAAENYGIQEKSSGGGED